MSLIGEGMEMLKLVDKARNVDLYTELGKWIDKVLELQKANDDLRTEVKELTEQVRFKGALQRIQGHTFVEGDDEEICSRCAEVDRKAVHILPQVRLTNGSIRAACPQCHTPKHYNLPVNRQQATRQQATANPA